MMLWKRAVPLGFLSWLIPFLVSFLIFPLKKVNPPLFEAVVSLVVVLVAGTLLYFYFRNKVIVLREAFVVAGLWLLINLILDYPMFAYGPMKRSAATYYSEIGVAYLLFPAVAFGAGLLARAHQHL
jgi:hypothetical protein